MPERPDHTPTLPEAANALLEGAEPIAGRGFLVTEQSFCDLHDALNAKTKTEPA